MLYIVPDENFFPHFKKVLESGNIEFKTVKPESVEDILFSSSDVSIFIWNFTHNSSREILQGKSIIRILEAAGVKCFPSYNDCWTYNDKISQHLQFRSHKIKTPRTKIEYWPQLATANQELPVVAKLRGGAGSSTVRLIKTNRELNKYRNKAFLQGHESYPYWGFVNEAIKKFISEKKI